MSPELTKILQISKHLVARHFKFLPHDTKEDVYQEGCIGAWEALTRFNPQKGYLHGYLHQHAYYAMIAFLRKQGQLLATQDNKRAGPRAVIVPIEDLPLPVTDPTYDQIENLLLRSWCLRQLTNPKHKEALQAYLDGNPYTEHPTLHPQTLRSRTLKAIENLRALLALDSSF